MPILAALLLLAFALRLYRLGDQNVWWDEGLAAWAARQSLAEAAAWTARDVHPPLYFWLLHFWRLLSGDSEFGLRYLSAAVGVLTVAAAFLLGQRMAGPTAGVLAALLVAVSRFAVEWSQEMRMYALAALWATLTLWAATRMWDGKGRRSWLAYVLFAGLGLYTLYLFASVLAVVNLVWLGWVAWRERPRAAAWGRWLSAQVAVLALAAPWLIYALARIPTWSAATPVSPGLFLQVYWTAFAAGVSSHVERWLPWTLPVLAVLAVGAGALVYRSRLRGRNGRHLALLLLALALPAAVVYLVSLPKDFFFYSPPLAPRYFLVFVAAYAVLLAWAITALTAGRPWRTVALAALPLALSAVALADYYAGRMLTDDYRSTARTLQVYRRPGDAVVLVTDQDWPIFAYHYADSWTGVPHAWRLTPEQAEAFLAPLWEGNDGVWLVLTPYAAVSDPQGLLSAWLAQRSLATAEHRFAAVALRFYARTEARAAQASTPRPDVPPQRPTSLAVAPGLTLQGYDLPLTAVRPGDLLHLALYWQATEPTTAVVRLEAREAALGQTEVAVPSGAIRQQVDLAVPPDAPPGRGQIVVAAPNEVGQAIAALRVRPAGVTAGSAGDVEPTHRLEADFQEGIRLLGYDLAPTELRPGEAVDLTLYWQAQQPIPARYKVFTHLLGEQYNAAGGNFLWGQQDNEPVSGQRPTTTWRPGEVIVDPYRIVLDPAAPAGVYQVEIGLYAPADGRRLLRLDPAGQPVADHLILTAVRVR
ncbi:MAG: glycosyltransferase family 39 protein [Caldilineales bacterium]|nr:glycosyltransferase family 39 protein [Caldilineales bacterium]MDW8317465.1 glycosyltransferase family 39 protein [Anaerolineae bacterium]